MATNNIILGVNKVGDIVAQDLPRAFMSASYASPTQQYPSQNETYPVTTVYTENAISMPYGIRSLVERKEITDDSTAGSIPSNINAESPTGNPVSLMLGIQTSGALFFIWHEHQLGIGTKDSFYTSSNYNEFTKIAERESGAGLDSVWSTRLTLFQNKTLIIKDENTSILNMDVVIGDPDGTNQFIELTNPSRAILHDVQGINLRLAGQEQYAVSGITTFNNYIILWTYARFFWSNPLDFTDFTPAIGGGGQAQITAARGQIVTVVPNPEGLTFYCRNNVVHCSFTGDSENPWVFQEVVGAGGLITAAGNFLVAGDSSSPAHVAFTTNGLQFIQGTQSQDLPQRVTSFVAGSGLDTKYEDSARIIKEKIKCHGGNSHSLIKKVDFRQGILFLYCADTNPQPERIGLSQLIIYNTIDQTVSRIRYDVPVMFNRYDVTTPSEGVQGAVAQNLMPLQFYGVLRNRVGDDYSMALRVLDFADTTMEFPLIEDSEQFVPYDQDFLLSPSVVLTELGINPDMEVEVHSVKLLGVNGQEDGSNRCTVKLYSEVFGLDTPQEFVYDAASDTYYGYICGKNPKVEISGRFFYLQNIQVEISRGAQ